MSIIWPPTLPLPTVQGYAVQPEDAILRTEMEAGLARQRRRFTNVPTKVSVRWIMRRDQYAVFEAWYRWHAKEGANWFTITLLGGLGLLDQEVRFTRQFSARLLAGGTLWEITSELEIRERPVLDEGMLNLLLSEDPLGGMPHHAYAVESNGNLWVWGNNGNGQLGLGDATVRQTPILHPSLNNAVKAIAAGGYTAAGASPTGHGVVLKSDGTIWVAGYNSYGQLGLGDTTDRTSFTQITHAAFFTDIVTGDGRYPSCAAISNQHEIYLWGYNSYGQCGTGNTVNQSSPFKPVGAFQGSVTKARLGGGVSTEGCVLQAGNQLWAAGYNANGNLGLGHATDSNTFQKVLGISGTIQDWALYGNGTSGWGISVLYDDGRVDACGDNNSYGECGTQPANLHDVLSLTNVIF